MDFDLDYLISTDAANSVKAATKFQPKLKPKPQPKPKPKTQAEPKPKPLLIEARAIADNGVLGRIDEEQPVNDVNQMSESINDYQQPSFEKSQQQNAESLINNFLSDSTTTTVNYPPCSEKPTIHASTNNLEKGPTEPDWTNDINDCINLECLTEIDPLTGEESAIFNDNEETAPFWESNDILSQSKAGTGQRVGKYKSKPKTQTRKVEHIANTPEQDVRSVQYVENIYFDPSQTEYIENEHVPTFTPDEILGLSSTRATNSFPSETTSGYQVNEETIDLAEISQVDPVNEGDRSSEKVHRRPNKTFQLIDEPEDEVNEGSNNNKMNNANINNNGDCGPENQLSEIKGSKSKRTLKENKKPGRKRKKVSEVVPSESTAVVKKKFSHSTRRNKRKVNPELLKMPEDELELHMHNVPMKELIRLREHQERIAKKEASTSGTAAINQSNNYEEDKGSAQNATYYNYGTNVKRSAKMKWSKQDTELFYEAIQQFGTDMSMIKECFPGRTREQIKSKYKTEERQRPFRLNDALTNRAMGHSHFKAVIERLEQAQAEEEEYEEDDPMNLAGEDDEDGLSTPGTNEAADATKPARLEKEVKDMEPDAPPVEIPTKSHDSEDDMYRWSQYKSEI